MLAHFFDTNKDLVKDKTVLELGAAAALPSFISAINDAKKVCLSVKNYLRKMVSR